MGRMEQISKSAAGQVINVGRPSPAIAAGPMVSPFHLQELPLGHGAWGCRRCCQRTPPGRRWRALHGNLAPGNVYLLLAPPTSQQPSWTMANGADGESQQSSANTTMPTIASSSCDLRRFSCSMVPIPQRAIPQADITASNNGNNCAGSVLGELWGWAVMCGEGCVVSTPTSRSGAAVEAQFSGHHNR